MAAISSGSKGSVAAQKALPGIVKAKAASAKPVAVAPKPVPIRAPSFTIQPLSKRRHHLKILIYGNYGSGKTYLAGTSNDVEDMHDILLINAEKGDLTLSDQEELPDIDVINVNDYKTVGRVLDFLRLHCQLRDENTPEATEKLCILEESLTGIKPKEPKRYKTVIIDSLSEVETFCMYQLLGISDNTKLDEETQAAEWPEYKKNTNMIQRLMRNFRDLPMHVIMTCGQSYQQDEQKKFHYMPSMTGKLSSHVQGFVDIVGYLVTGAPLEDGSIPRRLYIQPTGRFDAKCRFSKWKDTSLDNPSLTVILDKVGLS